MQNIHGYELTIIEALQSVRSSLLDRFFALINIFDHDVTYIIIIIVVWHLISQRAGFHLLYLQVINLSLCLALKNFFAQPRPYDLIPTLKMIGTIGYGFPSGAASSMLVIFGFIFFLLKPTHHFWQLGAIVLILLVGLTRVYVGAHFPSDVLGGYLLGTVLLTSYALLHKRIEHYLHSYPAWYQLIIHLILISCFLLLYHSFAAIALFSLLLGAIVWELFCENTYDALLYAHRSKKLVCGSSIVAFVGIVFLYSTLKTIALYSSDPICISIITFLVAFIMGFWLGASVYVLPLLIKK